MCLGKDSEHNYLCHSNDDGVSSNAFRQTWRKISGSPVVQNELIKRRRHFQLAASTAARLFDASVRV